MDGLTWYDCEEFVLFDQFGHRNELAMVLLAIEQPPIHHHSLDQSQERLSRVLFEKNRRTNLYKASGWSLEIDLKQRIIQHPFKNLHKQYKQIK